MGAADDLAALEEMLDEVLRLRREPEPWHPKLWRKMAIEFAAKMEALDDELDPHLRRLNARFNRLYNRASSDLFGLDLYCG